MNPHPNTQLPHLPLATRPLFISYLLPERGWGTHIYIYRLCMHKEAMVIKSWQVWKVKNHPFPLTHPITGTQATQQQAKQKNNLIQGV